MSDRDSRLRALSQRRFSLAVLLTVTMIAVYFGFIVLIAFDKPLLAIELVPGLSVGILLGALVIVVSWVLTWIYVRWTNRNYDGQLEAIKGER
jgi:uncharacterized membrane protein (DUF485 family)